MATQRQLTAMGEFYCVHCDYWYNHLFPWSKESETVWCGMCNKGISLRRLIEQMIKMGEGKAIPHIKWEDRYVALEQQNHDNTPTPYKED